MTRCGKSLIFWSLLTSSNSSSFSSIFLLPDPPISCYYFLLLMVLTAPISFDPSSPSGRDDLFECHSIPSEISFNFACYHGWAYKWGREKIQTFLYAIFFLILSNHSGDREREQTVQVIVKRKEGEDFYIDCMSSLFCIFLSTSVYIFSYLKLLIFYF